MPLYPYHLMAALVREHHRELYRTGIPRARCSQTGAEAGVAVRRPLLVRLLNRVAGPR